MTERLDNILGSLHSEDSRLIFLNKLYTPGNTKVADLILSMDPENTSVLENEVKYAKEQGLGKRFIDLAKRFSDHFIKHNLDITLKDKVIKWGNEEVADYVVERFTSQADKESPLKYAAEIARAFGKEDKAKECLETLLEIQRDSEYPFSPADTCVKLERYDEAIDFHLKEVGYGSFYSTLKIAKEYVPERLQEVAQKGFDRFDPSCGFWEIYTECADIVGKTEEAKKTALKAAKRKEIKDYYTPRSYRDLVGTLVKFGYISQAKNLVADAEKRENERKEDKRKTGGYYSEDCIIELGELYGLVEDKTKTRNQYLELIDRAFKRSNPLNIIHQIDKAYEITGDQIFLDKKLELYERAEKYDEASKLATQIGDNELADTYKTMHQIVSEVIKTKT